jgi:hypothetical protein
MQQDQRMVDGRPGLPLPTILLLGDLGSSGVAAFTGVIDRGPAGPFRGVALYVSRMSCLRAVLDRDFAETAVATGTPTLG